MRKLTAWITVLLAIIVLAAGLTDLSAAGMDDESIVFRMESSRSEPNGQFLVTAYVQEAQDLYAYDLIFTYDRLRLKLVKAESGIAGFTVPVNSQGNQIRLAHTMIGDIPGKRGEVKLATLTFERIRGGNASVVWESAKLVDSALASDSYMPDQRILREYAVKRAAFPDLANYWAEAAVREGEELGFVSGYEDGSFRPLRHVTRAEFISLLARALDLPKRAAGASLPFRDVSGEDWYASDITTAYEAKLIDGVSADRFAPEALISREQLAVVLWRALVFRTNLSVSTSAAASERFTDTADISGWALEGVNKSLELGLLKGKGENRFAPIDNTRRAEAVQAVLNMLKADLSNPESN